MAIYILQPDNTSYPRSHLSPGYKLTPGHDPRARCPLRYFCIYAPITHKAPSTPQFLRRERMQLGVTNSPRKFKNAAATRERKRFMNSNECLAYFFLSLLLFDLIYSLLIILLICSF